MALSETPVVPKYDAYYFQHGCGLPYERTEHWTRFFGGIADQIVAGIHPRSVLDAGCAMGFLVEALRDRGVEAFGFDVSDYALSQVREDVRPFCWHGSVLDPLPRRYDLIVCIEVLEHLAPADAPQALLNFCQHSDDVLFSSTPSDFREISHINVRPVEYWAELFAQQEFFRDVDFDATVILPWSGRFRKSGEPVARAVRDYERKFWQLQNENQELRVQLGLQNAQMRHENEQLKHENEQLQDEVAGRGQVIEQITSGMGWQMLQRLAPIWRFGIPPGSRRERLAQKLAHIGRKGPGAAT